MTNNKYFLSFILLGSLGLLTGIYELKTFSNSFGKSNDPNSSIYSNIIQPGFYYVNVDQPIVLPRGVNVISSNKGQYEACNGMFGAGFVHNGKREDNKEKRCEDGTIKTIIQDDYKIKYECLKCGKTWIFDLDESK